MGGHQKCTAKIGTILMILLTYMMSFANGWKEMVVGVFSLSEATRLNPVSLNKQQTLYTKALNSPPVFKRDC